MTDAINLKASEIEGYQKNKVEQERQVASLQAEIAKTGTAMQAIAEQLAATKQ